MHKLVLFIFIFSLCACKLYHTQKQADSNFYLRVFDKKKIKTYNITDSNDTILLKITEFQKQAAHDIFFSNEGKIYSYAYTNLAKNMLAHTEYDSTYQLISSIFRFYDHRKRILVEKYENSIFSKTDHKIHIYTTYEKIKSKITLQISKHITENKGTIVRIDSIFLQKNKNKSYKKTISYQQTPFKDSLISIRTDTLTYTKNKLIQRSETNLGELVSNTSIEIYGVKNIDKQLKKLTTHPKHTSIRMFNKNNNLIYTNINGTYIFVYEYTYNHKGDWVKKNTYKIEMDKKYLQESLFRVIEYP